jgi:hypothetical protein
MFSKKTVLSLVFMAATLIVGVVPAFADDPNCTDSRNRRGYNAGVTIGTQIVTQAWNSIGQDPDRFDELVDVVHGAVWTAISRVTDASPYTQCRIKGLAQAVCDTLDGIQETVVGQCVLDGQAWGELSAVLYCSLSVAFGQQVGLGLVPVAPTNLCGASFEDACQDEFASVAAEPELACGEFIAEPNDDVFADWQVGMCAYELP